MIKLKNIFFIAICLMFTSMSYAETPNMTSESVAKMFATEGNKELLKTYKSFPAQVDQITSLEALTSKDNAIIYNYNISMESSLFSKQDLEKVLKTAAKQNVCPIKTAVTIARQYNINFSHHYHFTDGKTIDILLTIQDMCD